jgi:hypothetical protein
MEINWKKPTSRETDEPFGWSQVIKSKAVIGDGTVHHFKLIKAQ